MKNAKIKRMVGVALLMALVVVLQFVGGVIPSIGGFSFSLVLIPIVLGAAVFGPTAGGLLGATFGLVTFINCVNGTDLGGAMVFQANPALCFVVVMAKGTLAGVAAGWVYRLLEGKNRYVAMLCTAIICPIVNTGVFLACMAAFYMDVLTAWANGKEIVAYVLSGLVLANFVPELIINVVFSPASTRICQVVKK